MPNIYYLYNLLRFFLPLLGPSLYVLCAHVCTDVGDAPEKEYHIASSIFSTSFFKD